ncbi:MAG: SAM-dependent DNA methyltransferase, partial [bacterium]|nr:SAM-dependent DNA methyltransferase [bacterium]
MNPHISQAEINNIVWRACDTFRGAVDPYEYKNYILTMLFIKYISDLWKDKQEEYHEKYNGDPIRVEWAMSRERFKVPEDSTFTHLFNNREKPNVGEIINIALDNIEDANKCKLENVFRNIDFNSDTA